MFKNSGNISSGELHFFLTYNKKKTVSKVINQVILNLFQDFEAL